MPDTSLFPNASPMTWSNIRNGVRNYTISAKARPKSAIPKWALIGAAVLILIVVATGFLVFQVGTPLRGVRQNAVAEQGPPGGASLPISEKSIAVLPLENLSEEKENAFFADGIQDELL